MASQVDVSILAVLLLVVTAVFVFQDLLVRRRRGCPRRRPGRSWRIRTCRRQWRCGEEPDGRHRLSRPRTGRGRFHQGRPAGKGRRHAGHRRGEQNGEDQTVNLEQQPNTGGAGDTVEPTAEEAALLAAAELKRKSCRHPGHPGQAQKEIMSPLLAAATPW